jgi:hypothetical protein
MDKDGHPVSKRERMDVVHAKRAMRKRRAALRVSIAGSRRKIDAVERVHLRASKTANAWREGRRRSARARAISRPRKQKRAQG